MRTSRWTRVLPLLVAVAGLAALVLSDGADARGRGNHEPVQRGLSAPSSEVIPNHLVVRFREGVPPGQAKNAVEALGAKVKKEHGRSRLDVIEFPEGTDLSSALAALEATGLVELAGYDHIASVFDAPNDPDYDDQWHLHDTDGGMWAEGAWDLAPGRGAGVTVAVIDTGVAFETNDSTVLWFPQHFEAAPDLAGVPIVAPWNFLDNSPHANDDHGHGTHVSGSILQSTGNGQGGAGVAPGASLMPLKVLDYSGNGSAADLVESIYYAVDHGADVINMSLGFSGTGDPDAYGEVCAEIPGLADALEYAFGSGVTVVAASGNDGATKVACPAAYHTVISVGATRYDGTVTFYSNRGWALDITAPGGDPNVDQDGNGQADGVLQQTFCFDPFTMLLSGDYTQFCTVYMAGTSMASPHVAGAAALLLGEDPSLTPSQVRYLLETTARDRGVAGRDDQYGNGVLDARAAVALLQSGPVPDVTPPPDVPPPGGGPAAPTALTATPLSSTSISVSWQDNANDETGYKVERRVSGGSFTQVATVGANVTSYTSSNLAAGTTYDFRVRAYGSSGDSYYSNVASATTMPPPTAPSNLVATAAGPSTISLSWTDNSDNETSFRVEKSTDGVSFTYATGPSANSTSATLLYLQPETEYFFRIRANAGAIYSGWSNIAVATTDPPPAAPSNLTATATGATTISLSWSDNSDVETAYRIERSTNGTSFSQISQVAANTTSFTNLYLTPGTTYWYRVRAVQGSVTSEYSAVASASTLSAPAAPTDLTATALTNTSIQLSWTDNSGNETGFKIEQSSDGTSFAQIGTVGSNVTTYTNTSLTAGGTYWYRVRAYEGSVNGTYSEVVQGSTLPPPAAPGNLVATALSNNSIRLDWTDNTTSESGFKVERSLDGASWQQVGTAGANVVTWTNTNLAAGTTYFYRVRAYEGLVNGTYSEVASATTLPPPPAPSGLTATPTSATSIRLDWVDNSASESGFKIERSLDGVSWSQVGIVTANATSWTNNSLAPDTPYWYRVRAYESSANGDYSEPASATTFPAPAAPTNLSAVATNSKTIELSWSDNSASEKGFRIERSTDGGTTWTFVTNVGANVTTYTQKFLSSGTTYMYRVRSYDGTVVSDWSNTASATP